MDTYNGQDLKDDPPMHGPCVYLESSLVKDGSFTHKGRAEEDHPSNSTTHTGNNVVDCVTRTILREGNIELH